MSFDPDLNACAALVEQGDPLRFRSVMAAPLVARRVLFPLYAFNVEVSRAPWITAEPMIAEMRLQWWRDVLEQIAKGGDIKRHEVATPLAAILRPEDATLLDQLIVSRRWDIYKEPFEDDAHFADYFDHTAGHLSWIGARLLGQADEPVVRDAAYAIGIAAWLRAAPALEAAGRVPMLDGTIAGVGGLATNALNRLIRARKNRRQVSRQSAPALYPAIAAAPVLKAAMQTPQRVADATLPEIGAGFAIRAAFGRW